MDDLTLYDKAVLISLIGFIGGSITGIWYLVLTIKDKIKGKKALLISLILAVTMEAAACTPSPPPAASKLNAICKWQKRHTTLIVDFEGRKYIVEVNHALEN